VPSGWHANHGCPLKFDCARRRILSRGPAGHNRTSRNTRAVRLQNVTAKQPFTTVVSVHGPAVMRMRVCRAVLGAAA
jgi:hypothetical protein